MAIDQFTTNRFENVLANMLPNRWRYAGMEGNERVYILQPLPGNFGIRVRSSIGSSGVADTAGEDSIRAVIVEVATLKPYGGKNVRWVSRVKGWERRLGETVASLTAQIRRLVPCPGCGEIVVPFTAQTEKNKGRPFVKCCNKECKSQLWEFTDAPPPVRATSAPSAQSATKAIQGDSSPVLAPSCPVHGPMVRMGSGKGWRCAVAGNRWTRYGWSVCGEIVWDKDRNAPAQPPAQNIIAAPVSVPSPAAPAPVLVKRIEAALEKHLAEKVAPVASAFPTDAPRPSGKRLDPETGRFVRAIKEAAAMLASGAVELTPAVRESFGADVAAMVAALSKLIS